MAWKIKEVWRRTGKPKSSLSFLPWPRTNRTHFSCCSWVSFGQSAFVLKSLKEKTLKQNFCYHRTIFWSLRWINAALGFGGKIIEVLNKYSQVSFQWGERSPAAGSLLFSAAAGDGTMVKTTYRVQRTSVLTCLTMRQKRRWVWDSFLQRKQRNESPWILDSCWVELSMNKWNLCLSRALGKWVV